MLELAENGDLLGYLKKVEVQVQVYRFTSSHLQLGSFHLECARFYAAELAVAIQYMHSEQVLHRDLSEFQSYRNASLIR